MLDHSVINMLDPSILEGVFTCYNSTADRPCASHCRNALYQLKSQIGCCYQSICNNSKYYTQLHDSGFITRDEFIAFQNLNNPAAILNHHGSVKVHHSRHQSPLCVHWKIRLHSSLPFSMHQCAVPVSGQSLPRLVTLQWH